MPYFALRKNRIDQREEVKILACSLKQTKSSYHQICLIPSCFFVLKKCLERAPGNPTELHRNGPVTKILSPKAVKYFQQSFI